jgi:hypothetical protein
MAAIAHIHAPDAMRGVTLTVRVTGRHILAWRIWFGCRLLILSAWVLGCGIKIESNIGAEGDV